MDLDEWKPSQEDVEKIKSTLFENIRYQRTIDAIESATEHKNMLNELYNTKDKQRIKEICQEYCREFIMPFPTGALNAEYMKQIYGTEFTDFICKVLGIKGDELNG